MKLTDLQTDLSVREIPAISIAFMLRNTPDFFTAAAVPPYDLQLLNDAEVARSYQIRIGTRDSLPPEADWREANLRETVWLAIWRLKYELSLPQGPLIRTSSPYQTPAPCHYNRLLPIALLRLTGRKIDFKAENPKVISNEVESFWLKPRP